VKPLLQILHLEDDQADAELVRSLLESEELPCAITCVKTKEDYAAALERGEFDVILSDFSLPRFDGMTALAMARERHPEKPIIFVSGTIGEEAAVEVLKQGAIDYVLKDQLARLPSAVKRAVAESEQLARRQEAEEKVHEQAALLDLAKDAILVRDLDDCIRYWNKSAERLYGWTVEEAIGRNANELFYPGEEESPQLKQAKQQILEQGEWAGELRQATKDSKWIVVESRWTLVRDKSGQPKAKLIINTDITERKKLEAQFLRVQRLETIGALTGGIAHDLNNVLMPIQIGTQYLAEKLTSEDTRKILQTMSASAKRGSDMIKQILAFARGVGGEPTVLDLKPLLAEMEKLTRETFPRAIRMQSSTDPKLSPVMGNATQLHQVLLNLCVNARDAMPQGGSLKIDAQNVSLDNKITRLQPEPVSGSYVLLTVSDTGQGISPELLDKIFEPFFTTKGPGKGTGLGLSTVQGIVKAHGGFLDVSSTPGQGTTFQVYLPAYLPDEQRSA
jgi:PAS domain S-box-containing protein